MKDGSKIEATKITEVGDKLQLQTKYGELSAQKAEIENLAALGFSVNASGIGPRTMGLEFVSEMTPDGAIQVTYYSQREKVGSQIYTPAGSLVVNEGKIPDGTYKEYYADGKVKKEKTVIDGLNNGFFKIYYPSGVLQSEAYFINGKMNGGYRVYYESGKLFMEKDFVDGILSGYLKEYSEDGALKSQVQYINGAPKQAADLPKANEPKPAAQEPPGRVFSARGKSERPGLFFIEGEVFSVGGADKKWRDDFDDAVDALSTVFDSVDGKLSAYPGYGVTIGTTLREYKDSPVYLAASYIKGPSASAEVTLNDSFYGNGTFTEDLATTYYRVMLGYKAVFASSSNQTLVFDMSAGFGGGKVTSEATVYVPGYGRSDASDSKTWTGLAWSVGPSISWEHPGHIFELGLRYSGFPDLKDDETFSDIVWRPLSLRMSFLF